MTITATSPSCRFGARILQACCVALLALPLPALAEPVQEIVRLKTRGDVEQAYLLLSETPQPKAVAILFTGGYGLLKLRSTDSGVVWDREGTSFLVINKDRFVDSETAVALVDAPSDEWVFGYTPSFRKSEAHARDVGLIVRSLRSRFPQVSVFLIGTSQGATSAAYTGKALGKEVDGVILTASVFEWAPPAWRKLYDANLSGFDFSEIAAPLLMVHHVDDKCVATPFSSAAKFVGKYPFITVKGGEQVKDNGCGPLGPHGFLGVEESVATEIKNWMHGQPYKSEVQ